MEADGRVHIEPGEKGEPPENQDFSFLQASVGNIFSEYGWYALIVCVGVYFLIQHLSKRRTSQDQNSASASANGEDSMSVVRRQEALDSARRRMQEELDAKAAEFREKQQRLEEEKRRQKIEMWENMQEGKSSKGNTRVAERTDEAAGSSTALKPKTDKKPLRNSGYNPLAGDGGGSCSWRPGRRGPSAGG